MSFDLPWKPQTEFQEKLKKVFAPGLVHLDTEAFVFDYYGRLTPSASRLFVLRVQVRPNAEPNEYHKADAVQGLG